MSGFFRSPHKKVEDMLHALKNNRLYSLSVSCKQKHRTKFINQIRTWRYSVQITINNKKLSWTHHVSSWPQNGKAMILPYAYNKPLFVCFVTYIAMFFRLPLRLTFKLLMSYIYIYIYMERLFLMFLDHTQRRTTVGRTPLDEWSARRRDL